MSEKSKTSPRRRVIYIPVLTNGEAFRLFLFIFSLTMLIFGSIGLTMRGWTAFTWNPLIFLGAVCFLCMLNLYVFRSSRAHILLGSIAASLLSPVVGVPLAGYILLSFGEPLRVVLTVIAPVSAIILILGALEATHLDFSKMETAFLKNKRLRKLPNGVFAFDLYWDWNWGKREIIPGFGWRKWFDGAVLVFAILAIPISAAAAFTSKGNIFNIPDQWGMATIALTLALLFRSGVTALFGQLAFLRYLERESN